VFLTGFTYSNLATLNAGSADIWIARFGGGLGAARYCTPGAPNSTGHSSVLNATGTRTAVANDVTLKASQLPPHSFGHFLVSRSQGFVANPGGSQGYLCVVGQVGRYVGPGQVMSSGASGSFQLTLDLTRTPQPTGNVAIQPGETWNFQAWHRDSHGGVATSNFTDAISITFD
jgi:hypothetical protein